MNENDMIWFIWVLHICFVALSHGVIYNVVLLTKNFMKISVF